MAMNPKRKSISTSARRCEYKDSTSRLTRSQDSLASNQRCSDVKANDAARAHLNTNDDAWHFQPDISETEPLESHIRALLKVVRPNLDYLKLLKARFKVDVFCGYRSNCDQAGFEVSPGCLELFTALEIPFGVSVIVT